MAYDPVAARYAEAAFGAAKAEGVVEETLEQLSLIGGLIREQAGLRQLLFNPDVDPQDKVGVLERVLKGTWSALVRAFVQMVVSAWRAEHLPQIVDAFAALVERDQGRLRVVVRTARPVPDAVLDRLRTQLERQEHKQIDVTTEEDPKLLGGLQVFLDHRVIDSSVQRQLRDLRERLSAIRVA